MLTDLMDTISEQEAIMRHLSRFTDLGPVRAVSGFVAALRDAREATGRDLDTGAKVNPQKYGHWLGAVGYMALLDQIGTCFKPKGKAKSTANAISGALEYFTTLEEQEIKALYALRCAFAHDYSLCNRSNRSHLQHRFAVRVGDDGVVVTLPKEPWSGDLADDDLLTTTLINLEAFGDLVETICLGLRSLAEQQELEIGLNEGATELVSRYSFFVPQ